MKGFLLDYMVPLPRRNITFDIFLEKKTTRYSNKNPLIFAIYQQNNCTLATKRSCSIRRHFRKIHETGIFRMKSQILNLQDITW